MRTVFGLFAALALLVILAPPLQAEPIDRSNPVTAGTAFLKAFGAKDAGAMIPVSDPGAHDMLTEVADKGEAARGYREIFGGWRFQAAGAWDGNFGEMRSKTYGGGKTYAMLPYHTADEGWLGVLMLLKDDAGWYVDDIEKWMPEDYRKEPLAEF